MPLNNVYKYSNLRSTLILWWKIKTFRPKINVRAQNLEHHRKLNSQLLGIILPLKIVEQLPCNHVYVTHIFAHYYLVQLDFHLTFG